MTLLNIIIVVVTTLIGLILLLWLLLRYALPWWLGRKIAAMANMPQTGIAARITLAPTAQPWQQPGTAGLVEQMLGTGFVEVGRYAVPEMQGMQLWTGTHPRDGVAAAVYDHNRLPSFFDVVRVYDDHRTCTVTTNPIHDPENVPPGSRWIADPALSPADAFAALRAQPMDGDALRVDALNFAPVFIELYARSVDHILSKDMPDAEKMRQVGARVSEATGDPVPQLDERQMALAVEMERASRLSALQEAIVDRFLQSGQIDAREWERVRDRVIVVHDLLSREDAADLARTAADWEISQPVVDEVVAEGLSPLDTFEKIASVLPESQRLRLLGEVDHPLYAQIYVAGV
jgi:hypothetical protein